MARKTMAFYPPTPVVIAPEHQLRVEIGPLYVACSIADQASIYAFEFFELDNDINEWSDVFFEIKNNSVLLDKYSGNIDLCYNFREALIIPGEKMNSAASADFLSLIYGESNRHEQKHDKLADPKNMVNCYRIRKTILDQAVRHFHLFQGHHVYTGMLDQLFARQDLPDQLLQLRVYPQCFIVVLMIKGQLQLIQSYTFETAADLCFYLLSILKEHTLRPEDTHIEMSGFIEPHGELHQQLQQLFPKRSFSTLAESALIPEMLESYHSHYFTPFFNPSL
ncbi:DUF3822 family protein [Sediminibacterium sp. KACHI17]